MHSSSSLNYQSTGSSSIPVKSLAAMGISFAFMVGTGGQADLSYLAHRQDQGYQFIHLSNFKEPQAAQPLSARDMPETLSLIREAFPLSISELATAFNVSRQAMYKWLAGGPVSRENHAKIEDLYGAATFFLSKGMTASTATLRRVDANGKNLLQTIKDGGLAGDWAKDVIGDLEGEMAQRALMNQRLSARKRVKTFADEWGTPMLNEGAES